MQLKNTFDRKIQSNQNNCEIVSHFYLIHFKMYSCYDKLLNFEISAHMILQKLF